MSSILFSFRSGKLLAWHSHDRSFDREMTQRLRHRDNPAFWRG